MDVPPKACTIVNDGDILRMVKAILHLQPTASRHALVSAIMRATGGAADPALIDRVIDKHIKTIFPGKG